MLDNGSRDGSAAGGARTPGGGRGDRAGPSAAARRCNDSELMARARGRYALLLNEDSELQPGATLALWHALEAHPDAACAGARLLRPDGTPAGVRVALSDGRHRARGRAVPAPPYTVQSRGERTREVDWCQSAALLVRRAGGGAGRLHGPATSSSTPTRSTSPGACATRAGAACTCPAARAIHHEQLSTSAMPERRIVELARNRDLYMRKHHSAAPRGRCAG